MREERFLLSNCGYCNCDYRQIKEKSNMEHSKQKRPIKVLFVYPDYAITNFKRFQRGVALVSSSLKKAGVQTSLVHVYYQPEKKAFLEQLSSFEPNIIAYSSISNQYPMVKTLASWSQELGIYTIYGGIHPTIAPEECIHTPGINAICRGEGDESIVEFVSVFTEKGDLTQVKGFWVKTDSAVHESPMRPLIEDLDRLPFPDYDIFPYDTTDDYSYGHGYKIISVQASRGCPYNCTYCCNHYLRKLYSNRNKYLRFRSVENVIAELKYLLDKYPQSNFVRFSDDTLSTNKEWFYHFTEQYKKNIGLPYSTNDHSHNINEKVVRRYHDSGCVSIEMGIENGNPHIRNAVMKRPFSDEEIINAFQLIRKSNIRTGAFNIFGFCHETMSTVLDTVKLNAKCNPKTSIKAYFQPFPGTEAYIMCQEMNLKIKDLKTSFFQEPAVELPTILREQLMFGFRYFELLVKYYKLLYLLSGNKESLLIRMTDKMFTYKWFPYKWLNKLLLTRMDIKERYPVLASYLVRIKRIFVRPQY
jgi:anaerobic magnesium-protoporphyrin IX monomethyl ester cyclase